MKTLMVAAVSAIALLSANMAFAGTEYNTVPAGDAQYKSCVSYALKKYEGGEEASPIRGQTKAQAWCTCLWNETPDNFTGGLAKFSESDKGQKVNKVCEKYSDWGQ
ncbi:hypothetical protein KEC16_04985 [Magnetospirillum sp. J10]|uniref:Uncharacterized protein n=2 Tax=Magnetospirillum sulfuroxidans TaxID=611300 RepID=A0ABS5I9F4_9PROT|nr:hypothetical protein [Magnetospirillum sulfuroxidans]